MKVALYARVSLENGIMGRKFQDTENQLVPLREMAKAKGYEVHQEYVDKESGANPHRPGFRNMLTDAHQGKFKAILVWKLDRFSREPMLSTLAYLQQLQREKVAVISLTESWLDTSEENPMSQVVLAVMAWAAGEERRKISERTKGAIRRLKAIGKWRGGRPRKNKGEAEELKKEQEAKQSVVSFPEQTAQPAAESNELPKTDLPLTQEAQPTRVVEEK